MIELLGWLLGLLLFCWVASSFMEAARSYRELYDDFGAVRYDVYPEFRRHLAVAALRGLLVASLAASVYAYLLAPSL